MNRFNENLIMLLQGLLVTVGILLWGQGKASVNTVNISATIPQKACSIAFSGSGVSGNTMDLGDINPADFSAPGHSPGQAVRLTLTDCGLGQDGSVPVVQLTGGSSLPPLWHGVLFRKGNSESDLAGGTSSYYWVIVGKDSNPVYSGGGLFQTCSEEGVGNCTVYSGSDGDSGSDKFVDLYLAVTCVATFYCNKSRPGTLYANLEFTASYQ